MGEGSVAVKYPPGRRTAQRGAWSGDRARIVFMGCKRGGGLKRLSVAALRPSGTKEGAAVGTSAGGLGANPDAHCPYLPDITTAEIECDNGAESLALLGQRRLTIEDGLLARLGQHDGGIIEGLFQHGHQ